MNTHDTLHAAAQALRTARAERRPIAPVSTCFGLAGIDAAYAVAEVVVPGPAGEAGNQAFPILAVYIFGKNMGQRKLEMTAPVTQSAVTGGMRVQVVLPKGVTLALR